MDITLFKNFVQLHVQTNKGHTRLFHFMLNSPEEHRCFVFPPEWHFADSSRMDKIGKAHSGYFKSGVNVILLSARWDLYSQWRGFHDGPSLLLCTVRSGREGLWGPFQGWGTTTLDPSEAPPGVGISFLLCSALVLFAKCKLIWELIMWFNWA